MGTAFADIDECSSSPCPITATCVDMIASYSCACADGFTGSHCETGALSTPMTNELKNLVRLRSVFTKQIDF